MAEAQEPVTVRGHPEALDAPLPGLTWAQATTPPQATIDAPGAKAALAGFVTLPGSTQVVGLRLVLPEATPPGTYRGTLRLGEEERPLVAEVAGVPGLSLLPATIALAGAPGGTASAELTAINGGNVPAEIPEAQAVGLFAVAGLDRALGRAFATKAGRGLERFDALGSALADEHGGALDVRTAEGAGPMQPGEARRLRLEAALPKQLRGGGAWFGFWRAAGSTVRLKVDVEQEVPA
jgi:hypothetical protein